MPGIWTSLTFHHRSIFRPIDRVFRIRLVISGRPELTALLTAFPRAAMLVFIVGIAHAEAFVLHLAPPTPSKRQKRRITTNPLLTTRLLTSGALASPQKRQYSPEIGLASMRLYVTVSPCPVVWGCSVLRSLARCTLARIALSSPIMSLSTRHPPTPGPVAMGA